MAKTCENRNPVNSMIYNYECHTTHPGNGQLVRRRRTIEEQVDQFR